MTVTYQLNVDELTNRFINQLKKTHKNAVLKIEVEDSNSTLKDDMIEAIEQVNLIKAGKLAKPSLSNFLNEINEL